MKGKVDGEDDPQPPLSASVPGSFLDDGVGGRNARRVGDGNVSRLGLSSGIDVRWRTDDMEALMSMEGK